MPRHPLDPLLLLVRDALFHDILVIDAVDLREAMEGPRPSAATLAADQEQTYEGPSPFAAPSRRARGLALVRTLAQGRAAAS